MEKNFKLAENETFVEFVYKNREKFAKFDISVDGDEEFKKYELRCSRADGRGGYNNLYRILTPMGRFDLTTNSRLDLFQSKPGAKVTIHRVIDISLDGKLFFEKGGMFAKIKLVGNEMQTDLN